MSGVSGVSANQSARAEFNADLRTINAENQQDALEFATNTGQKVRTKSSDGKKKSAKTKAKTVNRGTKAQETEASSKTKSSKNKEQAKKTGQKWGYDADKLEDLLDDLAQQDGQSFDQDALDTHLKKHGIDDPYGKDIALEMVLESETLSPALKDAAKTLQETLRDSGEKNTIFMQRGLQEAARDDTVVSSSNANVMHHLRAFALDISNDGSCDFTALASKIDVQAQSLGVKVGNDRVIDRPDDLLCEFFLSAFGEETRVQTGEMARVDDGFMSKMADRIKQMRVVREVRWVKRNIATNLTQVNKLFDLNNIAQGGR